MEDRISIKVTTKNYDELLQNTDFHTLDYIVFPVTMKGSLKGKFIFSVLNQILYSTKEAPTTWQSGRSLNIHTIDDVSVGVRYTETTCYFYCSRTKPSHYFSYSSQKLYHKIDSHFYIKSNLEKLRKLREERKEELRQEEIKKQQSMFDKLILKNIVIDECEYLDSQVLDSTNNESKIIIKLCKDNRYNWTTSYKCLTLSNGIDDKLSLHLSELNLENATREQIVDVLKALKPFTKLE